MRAAFKRDPGKGAHTSAEPAPLDRDIQLASGLGLAIVTLFAKPIEEIDAAGIVSKERFADQLEREVLRVQQDRAPEFGTTDLVIFRRLAKALRGPNAPSVGVWDTAKWGE